MTQDFMTDHMLTFELGIMAASNAKSMPRHSFAICLRVWECCGLRAIHSARAN